MGPQPAVRGVVQCRSGPQTPAQWNPMGVQEPVKVDAMLQGTGLAELAAEAREREAAGYDGLWSFEAAHDPFLPLIPVAEHTERLTVGTAIAVAFARNPMSMAYVAHDVQVHSRGRFLLGLGSQVRRTSSAASACRGATPRRGCGSTCRRCGRCGPRGTTARSWTSAATSTPTR